MSTIETFFFNNIVLLLIRLVNLFILIVYRVLFYFIVVVYMFSIFNKIFSYIGLILVDSTIHIYSMQKNFFVRFDRTLR